MIEHQNQQTLFKQILSKQENKHCADCNSINPTWASVTFGVFLCLTCAGVHRNLGPSASLVKSIHLDQWSLPQVQRMTAGNKIANQRLEYNLAQHNNIIKPGDGASLDQRKAFAIGKYIERKFVDKNAKE